VILALKTADQTSELYLLGDVIASKAKQSSHRPTTTGLLRLKPRNDRAESPHNDSGRDSYDDELIAKKTWEAGRGLARTLLSEIEQFLPDKDWQKLEGLIVYTGPGSFTGLRIGISTLNTIAYAEKIPIVGTTGENWLEIGQKRLQNQENDKIVIPNYGAEPNITVK
jgi:tRNA threonylcarbamoyladenosine biosynthesis protein TsaB